MVFEELTVNIFLQSFTSPALDLFFSAITYLGHPAFWLIIAAWLFWMGHERKSFVLAAVILFAGAVAGALKIAIARPRPQGILILDIEKTFSMPSGHATLIASFASFFGLRKNIPYFWKILFIIAVIIVAISRLYLGAHYISDVIAGLLLGSVIGWAALKAESKINKMKFHVSKIQDEFLVVAFFVVAVLFYIFVQNAYPEAFVIFGYFAGYAVYRHLGADLPAQKKLTLKNSVMLLIGTLILGGIYLIAHKMSGMESAVVYFILGIFITTLWPVVIFKTLPKKKE